MTYSLQLLLIAFGGALGAVSRFMLSGWANKSVAVGLGFPVGTLLVNVLGSIVMGAVYYFCVEKALLNEAIKPLVMVGFLGAFTTFSTFSLEVVTLAEQGQLAASAVYLFANVILSVLGFALALYVMRFVF